MRRSRKPLGAQASRGFESPPLRQMSFSGPGRSVLPRSEKATPAADDRLGLGLRLAAPYLAVIVFWCLLHSAWLAILAYHAQILWWSRGSLPRLAKPAPTFTTLLVLPAALAGPLLYFLLPYATHTDLSWWLGAHGLSGASLLAMVFYFGLVHPVLEQTHWPPLRDTTPLAHVAFAGYHMLVLYSLLTVPWLLVCFAILVTASLMWQRMERESGSLLTVIASHIAADLGIVLVAWLRT
jgi:hypothetical protein